MADAHLHDYKELKLIRITKIDNPNYKGVAGDKAFLSYVCQCNNTVAITYGSFEAMQEKLAQLRGNV